MPKITCLPDQQTLEVAPTDTILQSLLKADIPHAHVCGGNAYCSTCRVMILQGIEECSPPTTAERTLNRKLEFPIHVRLACQTKVQGDVTLRRLVLDSGDLDIVDAQLATGATGQQKTVALLFATLKGAADFDEINFPYDLIYILGRYFHCMNQVIERYGGVVHNYMGVWFLAVFQDGVQPASRAVWASLEMLEALEELNSSLERLSYRPLSLNLGVHYAPTVLVPVDPRRPDRLTVVGQAVSQVSRVEAANRELGSKLLVSETAYGEIKGQAVVKKTHATPALGELVEVAAMEGEPPEIVTAGPPAMPLKDRLGEFWQKFSRFWGPRS